MILYKVDHNYHKGIKEFEAIKDNGDGTFDYRHISKYSDRIRKKTFLPEHGLNQAAFFINYEDAKDYLVNRLNKSIEKHKHLIDKAQETLDCL